MKIENPFESGHIKNYILFYLAVVAIVILFFIATTLFDGEKKEITKKVFDVNKSLLKKQNKSEIKEQEKSRFKLLNKAY
ncbi:hypothetical protein MNB_SM-5-331 [hydrothermal vent metagenome]|uniref:Uncharacterized protein n=1 Tax=hydrothermal vent metagenome TaxID=652676 RepID=A0A1W1CX77_9ZZZZ